MTTELEKVHFKLNLKESSSGLRLDQSLALEIQDYSRGRLQQWIKEGKVQVNGEVIVKTRHRLLGNECIEINAELDVDCDWEPENITLSVIYQDDDLIVINKPSGLVVHPAPGNRKGTMVNALLFHFPELGVVPRAGIVHRLDKDTSGLLVVARNLSAHCHLVEQLQARLFKRIYQCIVQKRVISGGCIDEPIGRHPIKRKQMAVVVNGKPALTHYRSIENYTNHSQLSVQLETGRTHQIRVHMAYIKHPIVGDPVYGGRMQLPKTNSTELLEALADFKRQALHAQLLGLKHPVSGQYLEWTVRAPDDYQNLIAHLEQEMADNPS